MLDLTEELSVLEGIPYWKWQRLKNTIDALFDKTQKDNVLTLNEDVIRERLIALNKRQLHT